MPSLKSIRSRINSVKSTQKITRAMKLMAAARLRRAQDSLIAARPYAKALEDIIAEVAARAGADAHPLLAQHPNPRRALLVPVSSDRGLAGAFNSSVNRAVERFANERKDDFDSIKVAVLGRKGRDYLRRRKFEFEVEWAGANSKTVLQRTDEVTVRLLGDYLEGKFDVIYLVYNQFKSAIVQKIQVEQLLPIVPRALPAGATPTDYEYEPSRQIVLDRIMPMYVKNQIQRALLESVASELGAQMSAMDSASNNAKDMIARLSLQYNRARQAYITKELLEIIGGAEALKG